MSLFVSRTFQLADGDITCEFERPVSEGHDFRCDYRIAFPGRERRGHASGVDEVQALLLALQKAHIDLLSHPQQPILWLGMTDLGLPLPQSVSAPDFDRGA